VLTAHLGAAGTVTALPKENTLVITCDAAMRESTIQLLAQIDVPPRQVEITAKIFEVSHDFDFQMGAELIMNRVAADGTQNASSLFSTKRFLDSQLPGATPYQGSVVTLMQTLEDAGISIDASFQILADAGMITVVSSPRITVAAGSTGYMLAGQELPIQATYIINGVLQTSTTYKPVGAQLYITPLAMGADKVKLHTVAIVSAVSGFVPLPTLTGNNPSNMLINPIIDSREAETAVTVDTGNTLLISGLKMMRTTTRENKIPGLGDLPVVGWLFKNHRSQQQLTDLYFFVTPTMM
jgi:type II secretory pathway component GspD/PulD (secretin)